MRPQRGNASADVEPSLFIENTGAKLERYDIVSRIFARIFFNRLIYLARHNMRAREEKRPAGVSFSGDVGVMMGCKR
jgi:hypothetical protein